MTVALDPNWFYSTLAQCAAGIVSLIGALLIARLQQQLAIIRELEERFKLAERDLPSQILAVHKQASAYSSYVTSVLPSVEAALGTYITVADRTIATTSEAQVKLQVTQMVVESFKTRRHTANTIAANMNELSRVTCADDLRPHRERLFALHAEIQNYARDADFLEALLGTLDDLLETGAQLRGRGSVKFTAALTAVLVLLCGIGIVAPLSWLSAYSERNKFSFLTAFATALLLIPAVLVTQLADIWRRSKAKLEWPREPSAIMGPHQSQVPPTRSWERSAAAHK